MIDKNLQEKLRANLTKLIEEIEIERLKYSPHQIIKLVAVSKYASINEIIALYNVGQRAFGENKVQDLKQKIELSNTLPLEWHFIGTLQENKINHLLSLNPSLFQALDSIKIANALQSRLKRENKTLNCLLQVNISNETSKSGFSVESALQSYETIMQTCPNIKLQGIMSIASNTKDTKTIESDFRKAKDIFDKLNSLGARILSCGMSDDYKIAISNGANMLRIGSKIFNIC
ncbi:MAG: YggS family pyridoxal phosphate-dependent enzyme [Helicobacteraceae bacterium]|nr:YggS family pyridoxal phosphate-dependent enzyme [Helicobacteraceae bacterium]